MHCEIVKYVKLLGDIKSSGVLYCQFMSRVVITVLQYNMCQVCVCQEVFVLRYVCTVRCVKCLCCAVICNVYA